MGGLKKFSNCKADENLMKIQSAFNSQKLSNYKIYKMKNQNYFLNSLLN